LVNTTSHARDVEARTGFSSPISTVDGNYICRGCGPGDGFALLELCLNWKFTDALKAVERMVGGSFYESKPVPCGPSPQRMRKLAKSIWQEANREAVRW
jgi:hypothetical protein